MNQKNVQLVQAHHVASSMSWLLFVSLVAMLFCSNNLAGPNYKIVLLKNWQKATLPVSRSFSFGITKSIAPHLPYMGKVAASSPAVAMLDQLIFINNKILST